MSVLSVLSLLSRELKAARTTYAQWLAYQYLSVLSLLSRELKAAPSLSRLRAILSTFSALSVEP